MRVLVTGGGGFIGQHVVAGLERAGHEPLVLDRNLPSHARDFVLGDVRDASFVAQQVKRVDAVIHLAAVVGFVHVLRARIDTLTTGLLGTHNVLEACLTFGRPMHLTSSSSVYGEAPEPAAEYRPSVVGLTQMASSCYAYSKAAEECLAFAYAQERGGRVRVVRLFNVVGPGQSAASGFVLPRFVRAAVAGTPLKVYAPGTQTRTFMDVRDAVQCLLELWQTPEADGQLVNIGGTVTCTMLELAERVCRVCDSGSEIHIVGAPYRSYQDIHERHPDLTKLWQLIGRRDLRSLDETIAMVRDSVTATPSWDVAADDEGMVGT